MKNWKTTLAGIITGSASVIAAALTYGLTLKDVITGIGLVIIGALAKDFNVSGAKKPDGQS